MSTAAGPIIMPIAISVPPRRVTQADALDHALRVLPGSSARRIRALYRRSGVRHRSIAIPEADSEYPGGVLAPPGLAPSTGARMALYERFIVPLGCDAARGALKASGFAPHAVTHVIVVSCTGFMAPGLDAALIRDLGLPASVRRLSIGFMGCHGALNGLRAAQDSATAEPRAVVLLVCAELCSLHFAAEPSDGGLVANALFADGAAATIVRGADARGGTDPGSGRRPGPGGPARATPGWRPVDSLSLLLPGSESLMGWRIGDLGFVMELSREVPDHFASILHAALRPWLARHGVTDAAQLEWAVHPGGPRVLEEVESAMALPAARLASSRHVLAEYGNMSSPTVLFILRALSEGAALHADPPGARVPSPRAVLLAFGPGLALEAMLLERVQDRTTDPGQ